MPGVRITTALIALMLIASACGGDDIDAATTTTTVVSATSAAPPTTTVASTTTAAAPATTAPATTAAPTTTPAPAPTDAVPDADLPGEDLDFGYAEGAILSVFGVRYDDVLNVRSIPGLDGEIVATLDPLETGFLATGRHRLLPTSVWSELLVDGTTIGWVNRSFIGIAGMYTADVVSYSGASAAAKGETLEALAIAVAEAHVEVPEAVQRIELPVAPSDTAVWVDLVGIADDASAGYRMLIVPIETVDGWVVDRVDRIDFCSRGGSPGGLCV